jgi:hypothetical protein
LKHLFKNLQSILIIVLVIIILLGNWGGGFKCNPKNPTPFTNDTLYIENVIWDTLETTDTVYIPKWKNKYITTPGDTIYVPIDKEIDSLQIIKDYFTKYYYEDKISLDSLGYIVIQDTIYNNRILSRKVIPTIFFPKTTIIKIPPPPPTNSFYGGIEIGGKASQLDYLGGKILWKTKKDQIYGLGLGLNKDLQPIILGGLYWNLNRNKK